MNTFDFAQAIEWGNAARKFAKNNRTAMIVAGILFGLLLVVVGATLYFFGDQLFPSAHASVSAPAFADRSQAELPTAFAHSERIHNSHSNPWGGWVSITCINRDLFKYHNIDRVSCGTGGSSIAAKDGNSNSDTSTNDITTVDEDDSDDGYGDDGLCLTDCSTDDGTNVDDDDNTTDDDGGTTVVKAKHPNKGGGNGAEQADPGNHPEKGNDDEPSVPNNTQEPVSNNTKEPKDKPNKSVMLGMVLLAAIQAAGKGKLNWEYVNAAMYIGGTATLYKLNGQPCVVVYGPSGGEGKPATPIHMELLNSMGEACAWRNDNAKALISGTKH